MTRCLCTTSNNVETSWPHWALIIWKVFLVVVNLLYHKLFTYCCWNEEMFSLPHFLNLPSHLLVLICSSDCAFLVYPRSESESEEEEEEIPLLSEEEMNKLGAKLVKAEIMGNTVRWLSLCHCQTQWLPMEIILLGWIYGNPDYKMTSAFLTAAEEKCFLRWEKMYWSKSLASLSTLKLQTTHNATLSWLK